jgi:hypothetical protein
MGGCRNGEQQLVARRLWCTDHQLDGLIWWLIPACSHERYTPNPLLSLHRKGQLAGCFLGYRLYFWVSNPHPAVGSRLTNGSCAMSLNSNHSVLCVALVLVCNFTCDLCCFIVNVYSVKRSLELMLYCFIMCQIKIKFSYLILNIMPNVIVDVGLPTVDV